MVDDVFVKNPDGSVDKVETKNVVTEHWTNDIWKSEYIALKSEIDNYQKIIDARQAFLIARLEYLDIIRTQLDK